jgi:hypothetical protein
MTIAVLPIFLYPSRPIFTAWSVLMMQNWMLVCRIAWPGRR